MKFMSARPSLATIRQELLTAVGINILCMALEWFLGRGVLGAPTWPILYSMTLAIIIALQALWASGKEQRSIFSMLFLINALAISTALFIRTPYFAETNLNWVPFEANRVGCLVAAFLAPSFGVGFLAISAHALTSIAEYSLLSEALRSRLAFTEPITTIVLAGAGLFILIAKFRRLHTEEEQRQRLADKEVDLRLVQAILRLKSLANVPMNKIDFNNLDEQTPGHDVEAAVRELRELNALLDPTTHRKSKSK